jgi:predicted GNAT family acetyltransferase
MTLSYLTPKSFLEDTEAFLLKREIENNLILGLCKGFKKMDQEQEGCVFISLKEEGDIKAASIKTAAKAIVAGNANESKYMQGLAEYFCKENIGIKGVFGEPEQTEAFSRFYGKKPIVEMTLIVHQLKSVNKIPLSPGKFEIASIEDANEIASRSMVFEEDKNPALRKTKEQLLKITERKITDGDIFKWTDQGDMVSIAAINRRTKNVGIIGLVHTPEEKRGRGYASSIVRTLSEYILENGYTYCGLFTDKANPTSNHIYKNIGYEPLGEFVDIGYQD